jgi:hypothetical protein
MAIQQNVDKVDVDEEIIKLKYFNNDSAFQIV